MGSLWALVLFFDLVLSRCLNFPQANLKAMLTRLRAEEAELPVSMLHRRTPFQFHFDAFLILLIVLFC